MKLHQAQKTIASDNHRFRIVNAGRRFGKSLLSVEELLFVAVNKEANCAYCAPTYLQAREIAWNMLKKRVQDFKVVDINETRLEMTILNKFNTISKITLKGWESIESLRGQAFDFLILDEVAMYRNFQEGWQEIVRPTLTDRVGRALFISTPKGFNHWYALYNQQTKDSDYKSFHFTSYDNPFIPHGELEKTKLEITEDRFAQEILADFRKTEGLVYKEFDREKHVYSDTVFNPVARLAGIDWGWTNPATVYLVQKDTDRHYYISNEFYKTQKTTSEIVEYARSLRPDKVYPDPAEPDRIEEARKAGLNVQEVSKDIEAGISCIQDLFKQGRLHIHKDCINLIEELETYSYPEKKPDKNESELPVKENDHAVDNIRYVLYMQEVKGHNTKAHVHYSQSAQPLSPFGFNDKTDQPKKNVAYTHIPRL